MSFRPSSASTESLTRRVARFIVGLDLADVPEDVRHKAKLHLLDAIGCGIAGASSELSARVRRFLSAEHAPGPIAVLASETAFGPAAAAFANAAAINALDFDDGFEVKGRGMGHPGATLVAAALSAVLGRPAMHGDLDCDLDGRTFLTALIAGYEVNNRLIWSMQPSMERFRLVYGVSQHQSIGAAAVYGRLRGLDVDAMENALGFAATLAPVPSLRKYNWERRPLISLKDFVAPAAEAGVRAVLMDRAGLIGSESVLDGPSAYWRMAGSDRFDSDILARLGEPWTLRLNSLKPYPACRWMHCCLEAFVQVRDREDLAPDDITAVVLHTSSALAADFMDASPNNMVDGQFSFPFAIAALAHRVAAWTWHRSAVLNDPGLRAFAARISAEVDPTADALMRDMRRPAGGAVINTGNASHASGLIEYPLGSLERPLCDADVEAKFLDNVTPILGATAAADLAVNILRIDTARHAGSLFAAIQTACIASR